MPGFFGESMRLALASSTSDAIRKAHRRVTGEPGLVRIFPNSTTCLAD